MVESKCWAASVSECSGKISREHYVSRALFRQEYIEVSGLNPRGPVRLHIDDLVTKCLCERHNSRLSYLDETADDFGNCFREVARVGELRRRAGRRTSKRRHSLRLSGALVQQWLYKMAAGAWCRSESYYSSRPCERLARLAFGLESPGDGLGLGILARPGDPFMFDETWRFSLATHAPGAREPHAFVFQYSGLLLYVAWDRPLEETTTIYAWGRVYERHHAVLPATRLNSRFGSALITVEFDWSPTFNPDPRVVRLREGQVRIPRK